MHEREKLINKKKGFAGVLGSAVIAGAFIMSGIGSQSNANSKRSIDSQNYNISGQCDNTLWQHIYSPDRLEIIKPCITVSGTIENVEPEPDGDYHVLLKPDPTFFWIRLDPRFKNNIELQNGNLVTEPICANPITDRNIKKQGICDKFFQKFNLKVQQHVTMMGVYVFDTFHKWLEIHPITLIKKG